ncbi:tRNA dihydrouridine synthase [Dactylosporangium sp. CA-152071]|uniref:tRNA dihydrouridine synthase n=1 Tax=Dactylosporangium sp. CA-152071 TaxID=3239933 RepID=UPI003D90F3C9
MSRPAQKWTRPCGAVRQIAKFGCSVPKVTRRGGGSALPGSGASSAISSRPPSRAPRACRSPSKMRLGIDDDHITMLEAGHIAQDAWVALHARTAAQRYSGEASWDAIASLKQALGFPVLGNGDIREAEDALHMMSSTGCDGVVIGRGRLARPCLFAVFAGRSDRQLPTQDEVATLMHRHATLLVEWWSEEKEGVTDFRKHVTWHLRASR